MKTFERNKIKTHAKSLGIPGYNWINPVQNAFVEIRHSWTARAEGKIEQRADRGVH